MSVTLDAAAETAYLLASLLFLGALAGLSRHESARRGNLLGILGMALALTATVALAVRDAERGTVVTLLLIGVAVGVGAVIGVWRARVVEMTGMPELIAMLHSFVGVAAVLVGVNTYLTHGHGSDGAAVTQRVEIALGVFIGAVTLTGSVVAWGKLSGRMSGAPLMLPRRHLLNLLVLIVSAAFAGWFVVAPSLWSLLALTGMALLLGAHLVASIGGGDMPVVVSMLNSYSGWAAAAAGFMLGNDLLIITGALVGSSGAILSYLMCRAMNRSFLSVIAGGFGQGSAAPAGPGTNGTGAAGATQPVREITPEAVADLLRTARTVVVTPGYGMAVARAQYAVARLAERLGELGVRVRFGIHPVAGRLPGHMNVLLAEARVPYDVVLGLEEINPELGDTDVVLVIGANDTVNPSAVEEPSSPIAGMPVLEVWHARHVVVFKRSMATGYSGVDNPLFVRDTTRMLFGDAADRVEDILVALAGGTSAPPALTAEEPSHR